MTLDELLALLPPFEARTQRRAAEALLARTARGISWCQAAEDALDERARQTRVWKALEARLADLVLAAHPQAVADAFAELTGHRPSDPRTARAIRCGRLDGAALEERVLRDGERLRAEAQVALLVLESLAGARPGPDTADALDRLIARAIGEPGWRLPHTALRVAEARVRASGQAPSAELHAQAQRWAADRAQPIWIQIAALELVATTSGEAALPLLVPRLRPPAGAPDDDLFVRAAAARAITRVAPAAAARLLGDLVADEPSEHVRQEQIALLGQLRQAAALRACLDPARERSPRVRACAAIAIADLDTEALAAVLLGDPDELPRRIALEEAEPRALQVAALATAIVRVAGGAGAAAVELPRLAAEAAERLHHRASPPLRALLDRLDQTRATLREGQTAQVELEVPPLALGRALAVLSTDDFGLEAGPRRGGVSLTRGDRVRRRLWRALYEARRPAPEKRQGYLHTVGRARTGPWRAPPGRLAEVTATRVPGERVLVPTAGDWGRHLPTIDDLLDRPPQGEALLFSAFGVTRIVYPAGRWKLRAILTAHYAELSELRVQSLAASDPALRRAYADRLAALGFAISFSPYRSQTPGEILQLFTPGAASGHAAPVAVGAFLPGLGDLVRGALDPSSGSTGHLAAAAFMALGLFVVHQNQARRRIEGARAAIPLSIGGWGTRGKSGTERLKAALFQAMGCEVLAKTTGCEAMFIHALPDMPAHEVFIYRPHDKATIWEQSEMIELAARFGVDVFLWECMALRPHYVQILEQHWMRDPICTLTNTYPDHENIQGPAGIDVARAMVDFLPRGGTLLTAEDSMLPVLREAAHERTTALTEVSYRSHALLPADLLARFPYEEHPRNVALVLALARMLGIPRDFALKEMADWVVPDLGVLKTFSTAPWRGRQLIFTNGMSANERTGFLNNWQRSGFEAATPPGEWVMTVVNNRADRVSRSSVFADVIVDDAPAHRHVLIGTNIAGLQGYIDQAVSRAAERIVLFHASDGPRIIAAALERVRAVLARLRLTELGPARLAAEANAMATGLGVSLTLSPHDLAGPMVAALGQSSGTLPDLEATLARDLSTALAAWSTALGAQGPEAVAFLAAEAARHVAFERWRKTLPDACATPAGRSAAERAFRALYGELFRATIVPVLDPDLTGDQVVDLVARTGPPGFRLRVLGVQNIKGTGLDFVYRFGAHERTARRLARLASATGEAAIALGRELAEDDDMGILDGTLAGRALRAAAARDSGLTAETLEGYASTVEQRQAACEAALLADGKRSSRLAMAAGRVRDVYRGISRRRRADAIIGELVRGELSHERAAHELRTLVQKS